MKTFEDKIKRLEEINTLLQENKQSFADSQKIYLEGKKLSLSLEEELNKAEQLIEEVSPD